MAAEQGLMATPVIARSNPYVDIEPFSQRLIAEDPLKWCAIMPWDWPKAKTKEAEDEFLLQFFKDHELHVHDARFLAQVWKCIALYNAQFRIPAVVEKWIEESTDIWKDASMAEFIFGQEAQVNAVFGEYEQKTYPVAFLNVALKGIQTRLKSMGCSPESAKAQKSKPALNTSHVVESAGNKVDSPTETSVPIITPIAATIQPEAPTFAPTNEKGGVCMPDPAGQQQVPAIAARTNPFIPRSNGANNGAYTPPDHRQLNYKKPRGGHNNKRSSFSARNPPRGMPPPGFEDTRQPSNLFGPGCGLPPAPNTANGLPYVMAGRGPSGGHQFGGNEQVPPHHMQFQQPQGPPSGANMPSAPPAHVPRYPTDQGFADPRLYDPAGHGAHMQYPGPYPGSRQDMPPMTDRTNLQANAPPFSYEPSAYSRDGKGPKRHDSVTSRGGKRGYGGSMRGKNSRGGRESFSQPGNVFHEPSTVHDIKPRYIIQRGENPMDGPWRNSQNLPMPSQDARNSTFENSAPHLAQVQNRHSSEHSTLPVNASTDQAHEKSNSWGSLCETTCSKEHIADDCTTATKLTVFDVGNNTNEADIKAYFSQFGKVMHVGHQKPLPNTTHGNVWITFATVAEARKCLAARGCGWPFGNRDGLQAEVAKQHWDRSHRLHQPQYPSYGPPLPSFVPHHAPQTVSEHSSVPATQTSCTDEVTVKPLVADGMAAILSQDTTPAASGTTTPKKKSKSKNKKKPKKTDLLAEATSKALAGDDSYNDHMSKAGDQAPSTVVDDKVTDASETQEASANEGRNTPAESVEQACTDMSNDQEQLTKNTLNTACELSKPDTILVPPVDETSMPQDKVATPTPAVSEDDEVAKASSSEPITHEIEQSTAHDMPSQAAQNEAQVVLQRSASTAGDAAGESARSAIQSPSSSKAGKKAPIPKLPVKKIVTIAPPEVTVKISSPASKASTGEHEQKIVDTKSEVDELSLPKQRSTSGGSDDTTGFVTAPNTPAVGNAPSLPTEEDAASPKATVEEPKSIKPLKSKGPEQTESLSVFGSKAKTKRKVSKPTKAKGSIKGKPAMSDGLASASQSTSRVTSGTATPVPRDQSLPGHEPVKATIIQEHIEALHPEQRIHEPVVVEAPTSDSEITTPAPAVPAAPPVRSRQGTVSRIGNFGNSIFSFLKGDSQTVQITPEGSKADSIIEQKAPQVEVSSGDSGATASAPTVSDHSTQDQANLPGSVGLGISSAAADGQAKGKKKKSKSKNKKEPQAIITEFDTPRTELTANEPLYVYTGNDSTTEGATPAVDSPSGRKIRDQLQNQKENHIIGSKPMRKMHKRAASSKVVLQDSSDDSKAVIKSNRRASKDVIEGLLQPNRIEDVTDKDETDVADSKVFDSNNKEADTNDRVSPEVEEMRAKLNQLDQKEQEVKQSKGKEKAVGQ